MPPGVTEAQAVRVVKKSYNDMKLLFEMLAQAEKDMGRPLDQEEKIVVSLAWDMWTGMGEV